ncbi:MAG: hypothetical protein JST12_17950 [Armatimonadetes bacterium]|nr:hypothetical protein [Armatimonadota bacterium]
MTKDEYDGAPDPEFQKLRLRIEWLNGMENYVGTAAVAGFAPNKKVSVQFYGLFGVEYLEMMDRNGERKMYALRPIQTLDDRFVEEETEDVPLPRFVASVNRSDFANPEDIDWMFGSDVFSKTKTR